MLTASRYRALIEEYEGSRVDQLAVQVLFQLARDLDLGIVAEGVETREQLELLEQLGCPKIQGYVYSRPVPAAEIESTAAAPALTEPCRYASVVLVFVVDLKVVASMDQELDRVGVVSGASIYPFVWNVLLAARQAGFGGTITTLAAAREPQVQALLNIPGDYAVAAVVPLGRPVKQLTRLRRNPVERIASRERFDGKAFAVDR